MSKTRIAFIGAGNMAASLIGGLRAKGLDAAQIRASDPGAETRAASAPNTASKPSPTTPRPSTVPM
jgi:pyrroline-5-carboxylate reductase